MEWELDFWQALEARINLLDINKKDIQNTTDSLKTKITPSFLKNKEFIRENKENIYILSGGFKECITPIAKDFGIDEDHVFANDFLYDESGKVTWVDTKNPLSQDWWKIKVVNEIVLPGTKVSIWDGWNDYLLKEWKAVDTFFAFIENVRREKVVKQADEILESFDDFIQWIKK
jgi:D-3-phosphoglycerate dehydrogenase